MSDLTWHQEQAARRAARLHRWIATDDGAQCLRCGGIWEDADEAPLHCDALSDDRPEHPGSPTGSDRSAPRSS